MGMNPESCLGAWFEKEKGKGGTTLDQTRHSWFTTNDPKRKNIKKLIRRDEDLPPREMLDYPLSLRSLPPRKFQDKLLTESSKRRKEMSKREQNYLTTSTDYVHMELGQKMRKRGQLQDELHSIQNQIERAEKKSNARKTIANTGIDKKRERMLMRHYQSETRRSQARKIPRSAYEKDAASHTPTLVNRYADSLAQYKCALPDRSRTGF